MEDMKKLNISPSLDRLDEATEFFESFLTEAGASMKVIMQVNVAVDEVLSNIIRYSGATSVTLGCSLDDNTALLSFSDDGRSYDPTAQTDPDITLSAEEREIGGLGIFIVKKTMDSVTYERRNGLNNLTLVKQLNR